MFKTIKYRLYPDENQKINIDAQISGCRFIYNLALETKKTAWLGAKKVITLNDLSKQLPELKKDLPWLKNTNSQSLQASLQNLDTAYTKFFTKKCNFPKFKKKHNSNGITVPQKFVLKEDKLFIPKVKKGIPVIEHRKSFGKPKSLTIRKTSTGKYFAAILYVTAQEFPTKHTVSSSAVGIDLGIKTFAVTSEGLHFENPKFLHKSLSKLKYLSRKQSKHPGKRHRQKLSLLHEKIANQRSDFLHKVSSKLVSENQTICIENLDVKNMLKNTSLAMSITDAGWSEFVQQLRYKTDWNGVNLLKIGRFDPSSKTCSSCGRIKTDLTLRERVWKCQCGIEHNRDVNAAINIRNFALKNYLSGVDRENRDELPALAGVPTREM